jgi:hypothetical protein
MCDTKKEAGYLHADMERYFWKNGIRILSGRDKPIIAMIDLCENIGPIELKDACLVYGDKIRFVCVDELPKAAIGFEAIAVKGEVIRKALETYYQEVKNEHSCS